MIRRMLTEERIKEFENNLVENERSRATIEKYMRDIRCFFNFVGDRILDKTLVLQYKEKLVEEYALTSANSMLAAMNSFFRFEGWYDCCVKLFKIQRKTYCSEEKELTKEEYFRLVNMAEKQGNDRLALLYQTICGTGIRVSEIQYVTLEGVQKGEIFVSCKGKSRIVFIVSKLRKKILMYAKKQGIHSGIIFRTKTGRTMNRSNIWREMKKLCKDAGVSEEKVFPHNFRHLFARSFYSVEKDIVKLADILGHSNVNTTRIYMISTGAEHRKRMESMRLIV